MTPEDPSGDPPTSTTGSGTRAIEAEVPTTVDPNSPPSTDQPTA